MTLLLILCLSLTYKVGDVIITGNEYFSESAIKKIMLTRKPSLFHKGAYVKGVLEGDITAIKSLYSYNGFLEVIVNYDLSLDSTKKSTVIRIDIEEGKQTFVSSISFRGNTVFATDTLIPIITQKVGYPLNKRAIEFDNYVLTSLYDDRGFANTKVTSDYIIQDEKAHVIHRITEHEKQFVDSIELYGLEITNKAMLNRHIILKPGDVFRYATILKSQRNLYNLGIFKSIRIHTKNASQANHKIVQFTFIEKEPITVNLRLGYGTQDRIRFGIGITHNNISGRAWRGKLEAKISFTEHRINTRITFPNLFFLPFQYSIGGFFQYKEQVSFTTRSFGVYNEIHYPFLGGLLSMRHELEHVRTYVVEVDTIPDDLLHGITFGWTHDGRNDPLTPDQGQYVRLVLETSGIILPAYADYLRPTAEFRTFKLFNPIVVCGAIKTGYVQKFAPSTAVPVQKRFYSGGSTSIRGFSESSIGPQDSTGLPLGGIILCETSCECRVPIYKFFGGVVFMDAGTVWTDFTDVPTGFRYSAGIGLRIKTPLGSIRLDYGIKLNRYADESIGVLHFAIGEAF